MVMSAPSPWCCKPAVGEAHPMARPRRPPPDKTKKESAAAWPPGLARSGAARGAPAPTDKEHHPASPKSWSKHTAETPHRGVASPPSAKLTPWLGRAGHHPIKPKRNRRRRGRQVLLDPARRAAPPRQRIKSTTPPARNLGASTRRRRIPPVRNLRAKGRRRPHCNAACAPGHSAAAARRRGRCGRTPAAYPSAID